MIERQPEPGITVKKTVNANTKVSREERTCQFNCFTIRFEGEAFDRMMQIRETFGISKDSQLIADLLAEGLSALYGLALYDRDGDKE